MVCSSIPAATTRLMGVEPVEQDGVPRPAPYPDRDVSNRISKGAGFGSILQAGSINGAVHFHQTPADGRSVPRQLPSSVTGFVGRKTELTALAALGNRTRNGAETPVIVVVDGPAGVGKTTLALQWARKSAADFPDGQLFVDLLGFSPEGVPMATEVVLRGFLEALGIPAHRIPPDIQAKAALFRTITARKRLLCILDNAVSAEQVRHLLPGDAPVLVIVTSRRKLPGLIIENSAVSMTVNVLSADESIDLIAERIGRDRVEKEPASAQRLAEWCAGLPLALCIMAARLSLRAQYELSALVAELATVRRRLDMFSSRYLRSVRIVTSWSYAALSPDSARLFRMIGLHPGPEVSLPAAASLNARSLGETREQLAELEEANLLEQVSPERYRVHTLLREYAAERALEEDTPEAIDDAVRRFLDFLLRTAIGADHHLHPHRDPIEVVPPLPDVPVVATGNRDEAMTWFDQESLVLLNAVRLAAHRTLWQHAWQLAWATSTYFDRRGRWREWADTQAIALRASEELGDVQAQARARRILANIYEHLDQPQLSLSHAEVALDLFRSLGDSVGQARVLRTLGAVHIRLGHSRIALGYAERALSLYREQDDSYGEAHSLSVLCIARSALGDHDLALENGNTAIRLYAESGEVYGQGTVLRRMARIYRHLHRSDEALDAQRRALEIFRSLDNKFMEAVLLEEIGESYASQGEPDRARATLRTGVAVAREINSPNLGALEAKLVELGNGQ
ncbi:tetratricopeptide repeat protein [Amycolatopsis sp. A133]|uniref:ATP-binding protein n=1 Tax=Amycolatopsis sp. A133 TaxID=3064472 RepID=UPI0027EA2E88|nr:tetratricopeptide repeat protein [Amycolatopsis sp. A133]MDQ7808692.1 tetratricopeptide repeat protein [Amycolatopsis sp. A133]